MPLVDAHVHLPAYGEAERQAVTAAIRARGMLALSTTVAPQEAETNLRLRQQDPSHVRCFLGVHPSDASTARLEGLGPLWQEADGVGEIGLDPKYSEVSEGSAQMRVFREQLEVAERLGKPVQVHSRDAERQCLDVLKGYRLQGVLLHWFEGEELIREVSDAGYMVSFGPAVLYSKKLARMAARYPPDSTLTESDGPVSFAPLSGSGGPGTVPSVLFKLAEIWGVSYAEARERVSRAVQRYLRQV